MTYFQGKLHELMQRDQINQLDLADGLNCRQSQISNWLSGKSVPGYHYIERLSKYFRVGADVFFKP